MKIALGMSGGVDSSVSAALLKDAGHEVTGVYLECWRAPGCRAEEDRKDALAVALDLDIPFRVLDFREAYRQRVVEVFFDDYSRGLTPNPDIWCNTEIKFGLFYDWAMKQGFDAVATGHYAQIFTSKRIILESLSSESPGGESFQNHSPRGVLGQSDSQNGAGERLVLARGADVKKDQSYFLYRTRQEQLEHIIFPIGHLNKAQVRELAKEKNIQVAAKPDSQGICFIGDIDVREFLRERLGEKEGDVLDSDGNVVGKHKGHWLYTIGQRHGFELFPKVHTKHQEWKHVLPPMYVMGKDADKNTITVGFGQETYSSEVELRDVFWRDKENMPKIGSEFELKVRIRHGGELLLARLDVLSNEVVKVFLAEDQRGIAPGQSVVFYGGEGDLVCLGGGVIV